jgi:hypothetical protein
MPEYSEFTKTIKTNVPAVAAGSDADQTIAEMESDGTLAGASYTPEANITGNSTESRTLTIVNKGADGNGTTVMATLAYTTGVNSTDFNESAFTLSAVEGATEFSEGDILALVSTHVGATGLADPGGLVQLETQQELG